MNGCGEENHDGAMGREDLIEVVGRQIAVRAEGETLLRPHHDRVNKSTQHHQTAKQRVHDADPLVVHAGDPLAPEIRHIALECDPNGYANDDQHHQ